MRQPAVAAIVLVLLLSPALTGCVADSEWALDMTGIRSLMDKGLTGAGVRLAIIDTGIDPSHPEFAGRQILWKDFVNGRSQPYDDSSVGHGTHVAGIIVAKGDFVQSLMNGIRLHGAAPGVSLIVIKAVGGNGEGKDDDVAAAVDYASQNGANVIVMSLGGNPGTLLVGTSTETSVKNAINRGVIVVAAAGNKQNPTDTNDDVASPASVEGVIAVGAVDKTKRIAGFSYKGNDGCQIGPLGCRQDPNRKPEVVAPGVQILSTAREQRYAIADGTSQATPFVGAGVALLLEAKKELRNGNADTVRRVKMALAQGSEKIGPLQGQNSLGHDEFYGYGLMRVDQALLRL